MIETLKLPDWQPRMWQAINADLTTPFEWGRHDCVLFAAKVLEVMTGTNWRAVLNEQGLTWSDASSAARLLAERGGLRSLVSNLLAIDESPAAWVGQGDLVLVELEGRESLCVHDGQLIVGAGFTRLERVHPRHALCGWRV